jgi:hypothetical protein
MQGDDILRNKAYLKGTSLTKDEDNAADGRFSSACNRFGGIMTGRVKY